jgi:FkbM family methyltransferase
VGRFSKWRERFRSNLITYGIRVVCGPSVACTSVIMTDTSLTAAGLRMVWLRFLGLIGIRSFVAVSPRGNKFLCHIGDRAEYPFYYRRAYRSELELCSAWLNGISDPLIYDVGANTGVFCTQLAQMLGSGSPQIYAFEPVPTTFVKLVESVQRLGLQDRVFPVSGAVMDHPGLARINYSPKNSLEAQIDRWGRPNARAGSSVAYAAGVTLDEFSSLIAAVPALLKLDAEGSELSALRGAQQLLSGPDRPAIIFEYNPTTLSECGEDPDDFFNILSGYKLYYVDDLDGQIFPLGSPIDDLHKIRRICNLFAVPQVESSIVRWASIMSSGGAGSRAMRPVASP